MMEQTRVMNPNIGIDVSLRVTAIGDSSYTKYTPVEWRFRDPNVTRGGRKEKKKGMDGGDDDR